MALSCSQTVRFPALGGSPHAGAQRPGCGRCGGPASDASTPDILKLSLCSVVRCLREFVPAAATSPGGKDDPSVAIRTQRSRPLLDECVALFMFVSVALCCRWPGPRAPGRGGAAAGQVDSVPVKCSVDQRSEG